MKQKILEILKKAGISDAGFCAFSSVADRLLECRAKSRLPENSKTVIMCAFPYKIKEEKPQLISRYAAVPDYHGIVGEYLSRAAAALKQEFLQNTFEYFTDNSPIPEVYTAAKAGLGVRGDNGLLITERYGSWVFLGEIVTDLEIECADNYSECIHCGRCKHACPKEKYNVACLSAVSQKKRDLEPIEQVALKENSILWGCDICAEVCPMNADVKTAPLPEFVSGYRDRFTAGEDISGRAYAWRGEKVIMRNFNALF